MNVVCAGTSYRIFGEDLKTYHSLPAASYDVCFHPMMGFSLSLRADLQVNEEKIYGSHERRVAKVMDAFEAFDRNLGVILSGKKGIGKSLFARILARDCVARGLPLIVVSSFAPGIADFIASIEQEAVVLFDEFEKTFAETKDERPQESMLSLFDGIDAGKKLFVITCNEVSKLNPYLLNRPGRFHYHFTLNTPNAEEIIEYMSDKLDTQQDALIGDLVSFAVNAELTYDCLRAIAFELNRGYSLKDTLEDLNLAKQETPRFMINLYCADGTVMEGMYLESVDIYSDVKTHMWFRYEGMRAVGMYFVPKDIVTNYRTGIATLDSKQMKIHYDHDLDTDFSEEVAKEIRDKVVTHAIFTRVKDKDYKYAL